MSEVIESIEYEAFKRCTEPDDGLHEYRCSTCGRLLARLNGKAEIKCSKCGTINKIEME